MKHALPFSEPFLCLPEQKKAEKAAKDARAAAEAADKDAKAKKKEATDAKTVRLDRV